MADLTTKIHTNVLQPKEAETDGIRAVQRDISQVIAADRYIKATDAITNKKIGARLFKIKPPGSI